MKTEVELAGHLTKWLKADGWEVYEEVSITGYADSADIVAVKAPVVAIIEAKMTMSLALLGQARRWIGAAHQTYVAVPGFRRDSSFEGAKWVAQTLGIGLLCVTPSSVFEAVSPNFNRTAKVKPILARLRPEQQDGTIPAGSASGARYTPWKLTVLDLESWATKHPGMPLRELLTKFKHHYPNNAAARASLSHQIRKGLIPTLRLEGRDLKVFKV